MPECFSFQLTKRILSKKKKKKMYLKIFLQRKIKKEQKIIRHICLTAQASWVEHRKMKSILNEKCQAGRNWLNWEWIAREAKTWTDICVVIWRLGEWILFLQDSTQQFGRERKKKKRGRSIVSKPFSLLYECGLRRDLLTDPSKSNKLSPLNDSPKISQSKWTQQEIPKRDVATWQKKKKNLLICFSCFSDIDISNILLLRV